MIFDNLSNMLWRHIFFLCINETEFSFFGISKKIILEPNSGIPGLKAVGPGPKLFEEFRTKKI